MVDPNKPDYENTPASFRRPPFRYAPASLQAAPQVTIVTPFYNEGAIFHETARCVFHQSFQQWEWIIVNDASTDAAAVEILSAYRVKDPRVRVIDQQVNQGPSAARNLGFRLAAASYVVRLDSDDLLEPTALEKWLWYWNSTGPAPSSTDSPLDSAPKHICPAKDSTTVPSFSTGTSSA